MRVKCPNCGKVSFETTDRYDPEKMPHGGMLRLLPHRAPWGMDWLTVESSGPSVMTCPVCEGMLVKNGRFVIAEETPAEGSILFVNMNMNEASAIPNGEKSTAQPQPANGIRNKKKRKLTPQTFVCPKCGRVCGSKTGLMAHIRHCKE